MALLRICHFTSVHPSRDTRIFLKECYTTCLAGYEVVLITAGGEDFVESGVIVRSVKPPLTRFERIFFTSAKVYKLARFQNADIYHFHDPELLPFGLLLRMQGKKVIYDVHEDVPDDVMTKDWINPIFRSFISYGFRLFENYACSKMSFIITATPFIRKRLIKYNENTIDVNNYPILNELMKRNISWRSKRRSVCYVGVLDHNRGLFEMVKAIDKTDAILEFAGKFSPYEQRSVATRMPQWSSVLELGEINRLEVANLLSCSMAGLVLFHPDPNHVNAQPNKMFEYMSAGIPVIASNFPLWKSIIEESQCGLCVNPLNVDEIASAIQWVVDNPEHAEVMGRNGRRAVETMYNWDYESSKLLSVYSRLQNNSSPLT